MATVQRGGRFSEDGRGGGRLSRLQVSNWDIAKNHEIRKKYTVQLGENELVLKELDLLNEDANVYKLIGPVLVKQDLAEANANVRKRIEYISAELKRLDATLQDMEEKQNSKKEGILKVQQRIQALQAGKAKGYLISSAPKEPDLYQYMADYGSLLLQ
ncbi:hypothetical protein Cgig2_029301 [Carnegiea gigantea]|uniref:Prefoldin subunit 6 n=1 Tax=Carnegiea gigantea TaxID=171969 RepID=A0A9Q1QQ14_9CARY|nr:hypothetical protein Cgig2_029301 [Carnegiea gigantea]